MTRKSYVYIIILISALAGVMYGYDIGIISAAFLVLPKQIAMTPTMMGLIGSAVLAGGSITILIAGPLAEVLGRKKMVILATVIFLIGVLFLAFAHTFIEIFIGRLIQGVGVGIVTIVIPLYLAEILPSNIRGRGMTLFQLLLGVGIFVANLIGMVFTRGEDWRSMFLSSAIPAIALLIAVFVIPESPRWLMKKGEKERARRVLEKISETAIAQEQYNELEESISSTKEMSTFKAFFQKRYARAIIIVILIAILNQLTGINSFLQYSGMILESGGLASHFAAMLGSSVVMSVIIFVPLIALLFIDTWGRKKVLTIGTAVMASSLLIGGLIFQFYPDNFSRGLLLMVFMTLYLVGFSFGPGVVVWLAISELLPTKIRSSGMSIALFINSLVSALFATFFLQITKYFNFQGAFYLCALFGFIYMAVAIFYLPETKGKTLEEIEEMMTKKR